MRGLRRSIQEASDLDLWKHEPQGLLPCMHHICLVRLKLRHAEVVNSLHSRESLRSEGICQTLQHFHPERHSSISIWKNYDMLSIDTLN